MLFDKKKYFFKEGSNETSPLRGTIDQIIVIPPKGIVFDFKIIDSDDDVIYEKKNIKERLDDRSGLPVGQPRQERLMVIISEKNRLFKKKSNGKFTIIFKTRE